MKRCALVLGLVACGGREPAPVAPPPSNVVAVPDAGPIDAAADEIEVALEMMSGLRDDMCKCTDKACADGVQERLTNWSTKMAAEVGERTMRQATEAEMTKMTEIGQQYGECMTNAMTSTTP